MKTKNLSKNLQGTVLFTVICVMMVLIVVLMSTLVISASSQKKAVTNFTDSQSYQTALSSINSIKNVLENPNPSYDTLRTQLGGMAANSSTTIPVTLPTDIGLGQLSGNIVTVYKYAPDPVDPTKTRYKITAVAENYNGSANTVSLYFNCQTVTTPAPPPPGTPPYLPVSSVWNTGTRSLDSSSFGTSSGSIGGSSCASTGTSFPGTSGVTGSLFFNGDVSFPNSGNPLFPDYKVENGSTVKPLAYLGDGESIVATGNIKLPNEAPILSTATGTDRPYIYAGGSFTTTSGKTVGTKDKPIDIICHGANINTNMNVYGNLYSEGNVSFTDNNEKILGPMYVEGNLLFSKEMLNNINSAADITTRFGSGPIVYSGTATYNDNNKPVQITTAINTLLNSTDPNKKAAGEALSKIFKRDNTLNLDLSGTDTPNGETKTITLPNGTDNKVINLPTQKSNFGNYYTDPSMTGVITAEDLLNPTETNFPSTTLTGTSISSSGKLEASQCSGKQIIIDASAGAVNIRLSGELNNAEIIVKGDNKVTIFSEDGATLNNTKIYTETTKNILDNNQEIKVGSQAAADLTKAPNIQWFVGEGQTLEIKDGAKSLINAYIYALGTGTTFKVGNQAGVKLPMVNASGIAVKDLMTNVLGAVLAQNVTVGNGSSVVFIDPNAGSGGGGGGGVGGGNPLPPIITYTFANTGEYTNN